MLLLGLAAAILMAIGAFLDAQQAAQAWLLGMIIWLGLPLGSLSLMLLHSVTGGAWGHAIRPVLRAATGTLPISFLLFLPVLIWPEQLYEWSHPEVVQADELLTHKSAYLNVGFFRLRSVAFFALWTAMAMAMNRFIEGAERGDERAAKRMRMLGGPGLVLFALTLTFATMDWGMSLEPHWFSTMYGVLYLVGYALTTLAFAVFISTRLARFESIKPALSTNQLHDLGNLLFAFTMLWAYMNFSQFLIIWSANMSEETPWYLARSSHGWQALALFLIIFHFALPFVVLLSRKVKRTPAVLGTVATMIFLVRFADAYWQIVPAFHKDGLVLPWMNIAAPLAIGGLWLGLFLSKLSAGPLTSFPPEMADKDALEAAAH